MAHVAMLNAVRAPVGSQTIIPKSAKHWTFPKIDIEIQPEVLDYDGK